MADRVGRVFYDEGLLKGRVTRAEYSNTGLMIEKGDKSVFLCWA